MKTTINGVPTPTANLAINKSRLKVYGKNAEVPTYYLNKGQEFQIELFNPTTNNILAKISLNGKPIAQGGLVLRPGERAFLDRYIDVARKFKFDTYEVANTNEVKEAIKDNGDFKVEFYAEYTPIPAIVSNPWTINDFNGPNWRGNNLNLGITNIKGDNSGTVYGATSTNVNYNQPISGNINLTAGASANLKTTNLSNTSNLGAEVVANASVADNMATMDFMDMDLSIDLAPEPVKKEKRSGALKSKRRVTKSVETGRVAEGSQSNQQMTTVNMNWITIPFHTVEYKMLPLSQKVNTVEDTQVKNYCTNCGSKNKSSFKFCPSCGAKA